MDTIGVIHTVFGAVSLILGLSIFILPKGTGLHIILGRTYALCMLGLNTTAFLIYKLFGRFGAFHISAIIGLATLLGGLIPAMLKRPRKRWMVYHYNFMCWSYVGLVAAAVAEVTGRIPGWNFAVAVIVPGSVIIGIGATIIFRRQEQTLDKARHGRRSTLPNQC